ncbi:MAG TPA: glycosyltransferase [Segetibacter sp.]|jgi:rhamnosyl/mannosyltransferase
MTSQVLKILQVGKFFYPDKGGIESTTKAIFDEFSEKGDASDVLCFQRSKTSSKVNYGDSFVLKSGTLFQIASTPISFKFFYWFFKIRNDYDIVHIHVPNPLAAIALFLFPVKGKVVIHWHSDILTHKFLYFFLSFFEHLMLKKADVILATSPVCKKESPVLRKFTNKVKVLSSSTSESKFPVKAERIVEIKERYNNKKIIFSLGRFIYYKGFEYLIEAAKYLPDDFIILIGGGGPLKDKYQEIISELNLQNKVFLVLEISQGDVGNYYSACDVYCLPSCEKTEAFGLVLVEAMMFSKPLVATNIPGSGVSWVNEHNLSGINVEPKNPRDLAKGIMEIFSGDYDSYSRNSRKRFEENFSDEEMLSRLRNYYLQLVDVSTPIIKHLTRKAI